MAQLGRRLSAGFFKQIAEIEGHVGREGQGQHVVLAGRPTVGAPAGEPPRPQFGGGENWALLRGGGPPWAPLSPGWVVCMAAVVQAEPVVNLRGNLELSP